MTSLLQQLFYVAVHQVLWVANPSILIATAQRATSRGYPNMVVIIIYRYGKKVTANGRSIKTLRTSLR